MTAHRQSVTVLICHSTWLLALINQKIFGIYPTHHMLLWIGAGFQIHFKIKLKGFGDRVAYKDL